jgi:YegS/Rv2252/BmrU family lipid kinase
LKKALIIINPVSGISNKTRIKELLHQKMDRRHFRHEIVFSQYAGHAEELSREAAQAGLHLVVAVGGDGSVNEAGAGLAGSHTHLGIIPTGSGNGLAHYLHIPFNLDRAIECLNQLHSRKIDTGTLNGHFFCNVAGAGFDAHVATKFAKADRRGFWSYFKLVLEEYPRYKARTYKLNYQGEEITRKALLITFANGNQFGNNAIIAPDAKADDGLLDICIMSKVPLIEAPLLGQVLMLKLIDRTHYVEYIKTPEITVVQEADESCHLDGEPLEAGKVLQVKVNPLSLNVVVPR